MTGIGAVTLGATLPSPDAKPKDAKDAARQFESLLLGQMLESTMPEDEDAAGAPMKGLAVQQFAKVMADSGGLGLVKLLGPALGAPSSGVDTAKLH